MLEVEEIVRNITLKNELKDILFYKNVSKKILLLEQ